MNLVPRTHHNTVWLCTIKCFAKIHSLHKFIYFAQINNILMFRWRTFQGCFDIWRKGWFFVELKTGFSMTPLLLWRKSLTYRSVVSQVSKTHNKTLNNNACLQNLCVCVWAGGWVGLPFHISISNLTPQAFWLINLTKSHNILQRSVLLNCLYKRPELCILTVVFVCAWHSCPYQQNRFYYHQTSQEFHRKLDAMSV